MRASGACTAALGVPGELIPPAPRSRFEAVDSYGVIRRCRTGFKVGPLLSETEEEADVLFWSLAAEAGGEPVFLDIPEPNSAAWALAERHGLSPVFETARMYRGPDPQLPLSRTFEITTVELG
jgi:hypothetical protein